MVKWGTPRRLLVCLSALVLAISATGPPAQGAVAGDSVAGGRDRGAGAHQLYDPYGVAVDPAGNVYVADTSNHRVQRWAPGASEGVTVAGGNGAGSGLDQLHWPRDIALSEDGALLIADTHNDRVIRWAVDATEGQVISVVTAQPEAFRPYAVISDGAGGFYVSDGYESRVLQWSAGATDPVVVLGGVPVGAGADQLDQPRGLALDAAGNLYVADRANHRVQRLSPGETNAITVAGGNGPGPGDDQLSAPYGLAVGADGALFVSDAFEGRVQRWDVDATEGVTVAGAGPLVSAAGLFHPRALALHDGGIYIVDQGNSRIQFWDLVTPDPELLRVATVPAVPSTITVDGVTMNAWGLTWVELEAGPKTICFGDVLGWTAPPCEVVDMLPNQTTHVDAPFVLRGFLRVETVPAVPASILVDGVVRNDWGLWADVEPGLYEVCFGAVAGFDAPPCQNVEITAGATTDVVGAYTPSAAVGPTGHGFLRVTTDPPVPSMISVDGTERDRWALTWMKVTPGTYEVCFGDMDGFGTPGCESVEVLPDDTTTVVGAYERYGAVRVETAPPEGSTITINGVRRDAWSLWVDLPPGTYEVCFEEWGGFAPGCQTTALGPGGVNWIVGRWPR